MNASALRHFEDFLGHAGVDPRVKSLLQREYPEDNELFPIFVEHSSAVATLARELARDHQADEMFVWEAAWLHDIGIRYTHAPGIRCHGDKPYITHGVIGAELCRQMGLPRHARICECHVGTGLSAQEISEGELPLPLRDMLCETDEEEIVCYADNFFSKSSPDCVPWEEVQRRVARHGPGQLERLRIFQKKYGVPWESELLPSSRKL